MSDDLLNRATQALRNDDGVSAMPGKHVILQRIEGERRTRARRLAVLVPMAAVVVTSTAIAAATGALPVAWQSVRAWWSDAPQETPTVVAPSRRPATMAAPTHGPSSMATAAPATTVGLAPAPPAAEVAPQSTEPPSVAPRGGMATTTLRAATPARVAAEPPAAAADVPPPAGVQPAPAADVAPPDGLEQFRAAQRLQQRDRQWAAALTAWDAYLQQAPHGALAPEARWNRALCLVRLDRRAEARLALQPFASGAEGGYRQAQAMELLAALDAAPDGD
jgi:hypothetical protein